MRFGSRMRVIALAVASAAAVMVAAYQIERVFEPEYQQWTVALIPLLSLGIGLILDGRWLALKIAVHVVVGIGAMTYVVNEAGGRVPEDLGRAVIRGLTDTLSTRWPVPVMPSAVGGFALGVAAAAAVAVELALARRFSVSLLLPSVLLFVVVALLAAPAGPPSPRVLVAYSLLALAILRLAALTRTDLPNYARGRAGEAERRSRVTMAIVGTAAVVVGVIPPMVETAAGEAERFDPRDRLPEEIVALDEISPLSRLDEWRNRTPADVVFETTSPNAQPWRLVALTRYDGRSWMPADDYRPSGEELQQPTDGVESEEVTVTVGALDARWLPAPDRVLTVSQPVYVDSTLGGLLVDDVPEPGLQYDLTIEPFDADAAELTGAAVGEPRVTFVDFELPAAIRQLASTITAGAEAPYERALRISTYLRDRYRLVTDAPAGHSLNVLQIFLDRTKSGRDEQFVASFAVLAAAAGLPTRISVGFDTEVDPAGGTVARSDHVRAWPEIEFAGVGWVPFDPVPEEEQADATSGGQAVAPVTERPDEVPPTTAAPPVASTAPPVEPEQQDLTGFTVPTVVGRSALIALAVLIVLASYALVVIRLKSSRKSRRRFSNDPEQRVTGAFRSGVDVLIDLGSTAPTSKTDRELVVAGVSKLGDAASELTPVATLATQAVYDSPEPDDELADDAWDQLHHFERQTAHELGRWRYWRAKLSLRSFRRGLPD